MKSAFLVLAVLAAPLLGAAPSQAQGTPQTLVNMNVSNVSSGWRATKIIGATIVNEAEEKIGTIDDLIVSRTDRIPYAIVSVGGFLGVGNKLVAVPMANLQFSMDHTLMTGADKTSLKALPAFTYSK
ncbi:MAG: PRC-barrel domain-containing protein [Rhodospirillaceae bacterium]